MTHNHDEDYSIPYHWLCRPDDLCNGGIEWCQRTYLARKLTPQIENGRFIDVGCGDGAFTERVAQENPSCEVLGIDTSAKAIALARAMSRRAAYECIPLEDIDGPFDVVFALEIMEHLPKEYVPIFLSHARHLLAPNGCFIFSVPTPLLPMSHPGHIQHFSQHHIEALIEDASMKLTKTLYHLDTRKRGSHLWRLCFGLYNNRLWTINALQKVLVRIHNRLMCDIRGDYAGRVVGKALTFEPDSAS